MSSPITAFWDAAADSFDDEPDHGLAPPGVKTAWVARLAAWLPAAPADVVDLGCGTGSLLLVLAEQGHRVSGVDLSPRMLEHARRKFAAAGLDADLLVGDAADPPVPAHHVDVVLARHVLWTLPDPVAALRRWTALLRPGGRLVLIEGRWDTSAPSNTYVEGSDSLPWTGGVTAAHLAAALRPLVADLRIEPLTDPNLWGHPITDERYCVLATCS